MRTVRTRFLLTPMLLLAAIGLGGPDGARAEFATFYVDPELSRLEVSMPPSFDVAVPPNQTHQFTAASQAGLPGTSPGSLPGIGADGFETFLTGTLLVDDRVQSQAQLTIHSEASMVRAADIGAWLPGVAGTAGAAPANASFQVTNATGCSPGACMLISLDMRVAVRGFEGAPDASLSLASIGPDLWSASGSMSVVPVGGWIDFDSTIPGMAGRSALTTAFPLSTNGISSLDGRYEIVAPDLAKLTLPFTLGPISVFPEDLMAEIDGSSSGATVTGQIVAWSQPVPEPGFASMWLAGAGLLAWLAGRSSRAQGRA